MGLHREQSRGKLPRDPLVLILGAPSHCSVIPSMSYHCGSHRNNSKHACVCVCLRVHVFSQVFDGAVIVLSLAPMVASTVANGPSSPWDAIGLIITLRIWRVKRIIDGETGRGWGGGGWRPLLPVLYCQVTEIDTAVCSLRYRLHSILKWLAQLFFFSLFFFLLHYFPPDTIVNNLRFEAHAAAATCRLFYHIGAYWAL